MCAISLRPRINRQYATRKMRQRLDRSGLRTRVYLFLRIGWPLTGGFAMNRAQSLRFRSPMVSPESLQSFLALAFGFAFAGLLASAYQLVTERPAGFGLLQRGSRFLTFAAVPFLAFA